MGGGLNLKQGEVRIRVNRSGWVRETNYRSEPSEGISPENQGDIGTISTYRLQGNVNESREIGRREFQVWKKTNSYNRYLVRSLPFKKGKDLRFR